MSGSASQPIRSVAAPSNEGGAGLALGLALAPELGLALAGEAAL